ncbi:MAG: hypothetical protein F6K54_08170 [Okeania sp. SIO3B5]|uniref:MAE_28990/MAE_18760 family HEPN-like nuclease n=1 Tax=Okeania sp. SIO3B5 TaxID=2607811 RepID=UPI0013FF65B1|nr:MAE_28990/MAE_18760 family HEPN-like nuclease [Okeania sp. SIO3B5]NEO53061.1 hypothetical protein [Okeania sp. SIO3B5]
MTSISFVFEDFNERSKEVSEYLTFINDLQKEKMKLITESQENSRPKKIDKGLEDTLKASAYLLLYNLIESTMRNAIEAIFDELKNQGVSFDQIRPELKKIVLDNLKQRNSDKITEKIKNISLDIITIVFDKSVFEEGELLFGNEKLFSGNFDARKIKTVAKEYGFSSQTKTDSRDLLIVKTKRKDLAHGIKSFAEVGREKSVDELIKIQDKVVEYLRQILENIETYLDNQDYLDSSTNTL